MFLSIFVIGCSTENPLCTDNYCVTGEIFLKSELEEDQEFSELPIDDDTLFSVFNNAMQKTEEAETQEDPIVTKWKEKIVSDGGTINIPVLDSLTITTTGHIRLNPSPFGGSFMAKCHSFLTRNFITHGSIAIRLPPNSDDLVLLIDTDVTDKICGITITDDLLPGTYRLLVDMTINGVRDVFVSKNSLQVE